MEGDRTMLRNMFKHIALVMRHKHKVFVLCTKAGIPWQGLWHDMSKFSPTEFWESVRYFNGEHSPITECIRINGYSKAWLHHKGRNKHHYEYWYDEGISGKMPIIPYKYVVEMICDNLAAGMTYMGKNWTADYQYKYWFRRMQKSFINPTINGIVLEVLEKVSLYGIDNVIKKDVLKEIYDKRVNF